MRFSVAHTYTPTRAWKKLEKKKIPAHLSRLAILSTPPAHFSSIPFVWFSLPRQCSRRPPKSITASGRHRNPPWVSTIQPTATMGWEWVELGWNIIRPSFSHSFRSTRGLCTVPYLLERTHTAGEFEAQHTRASGHKPDELFQAPLWWIHRTWWGVVIIICTIN